MAVDVAIPGMGESVSEVILIEWLKGDGEYVELPPGTYDVVYTRGPEYLPQTKQITVPIDAQTLEVCAPEFA